MPGVRGFGRSCSGPLSLPTPFSLTQDVELDASGASSISIDASFDVTMIPEPSTIVIGAFGTAALFASRRRK